jgi:hypothetical protein
LAKSYVLKGTENEYLLVIRLEDEEMVHKIIESLIVSKDVKIKHLAEELKKSWYSDDNRRDSGKVRPKNKGKSSNSNVGRRRKTENT